MASVKLTWPHCVNQMGKTHSKPLAAWHGRGIAWAWHAMCESAFTGVSSVHLLVFIWFISYFCFGNLQLFPESR